jgi:hypothetical protein
MAKGMAMNVTRAPQGNQPHSNQPHQPHGNQPHGQPHQPHQPRSGQPLGQQPHDGPASDRMLEQVRARIRASQGAARQARLAGAGADQALADAELLRRRLPVVTSAAAQARGSVRLLRGITPVSLWYAGRRDLAGERARRSTQLQAALAEREVLAALIAEQDAKARQLRAESLRLRATASALPRLLDEAAACMRRTGGPAAEALAVAEAGLEPVLRREANLDQAVRWVRWAQQHLGTAMDRLGDGRTWAGYRDYFSGSADEVVQVTTGRLLGHDAVRGPALRRVEAARQALAGVRDVLAVLAQALGDLDVSTDPLVIPDLPADLEPWFTGLPGDVERQARVTAALETCEQLTGQVTALRERIEGDRMATLQVLDGRRARWGALLRGE